MTNFAPATGIELASEKLITDGLGETANYVEMILQSYLSCES